MNNKEGIDMKKNIIYAIVSLAMVLFASCQKPSVNSNEGHGYLTFSEFSLDLDEAVETKASAASRNYNISVLDADGNVVYSKTYGDVLDAGSISLPAGTYTLVAKSLEQDVPEAAFEHPIYGVEEEFSITAGETTSIGSLTCTLLQCKVTVSYSDEFLASVTGAGSTKVSVTAGYPLEYQLQANGRYDQSAGYFAVNGTTMEVVFSGSIEGKSQKMTKVFNDIKPRQWRQIKFVKKTNAQGNATFDIVINDLIDDATLNNSVSADKDENVIGADPMAPKDDGGIKILNDGCDASITFTEKNIVNDPVTGEQINSTGVIDIPITSNPMAIKLKAVVPAGIQKFTVDIATDNSAFANAVAVADATHLDLVNPSEANMVIFEVVPFPYGADLMGATERSFDISNAQAAIVNYKGTHVFTLTIVDVNGKKKTTEVTMSVK